MAEATVVLGPIASAANETAGPRLTWALEPGRPNPFRGQTTISFSLAERAPVRVSVYDLAGRLVSRLVDGVLDADRYEIQWNGRDAGGRALGAGMYFIRYEGGPATISRKVVLLN
jgi:hypothetical protein